MKNIPEYVEEFDHVVQKCVGEDMSKEQAQNWLTTTLTQLQKDTREQMRKEFVERIEGMLMKIPHKAEGHKACTSCSARFEYNQALTDLQEHYKLSEKEHE